PTPTPTQTSVFQTRLQEKQIDENIYHRLYRRRECAGGAFPGRQPEGMTRFFRARTGGTSAASDN
ncbi:hypothetical protein, partial [Citrobacter pasteurii]|uniref:hypothetical protein n=1 Tax=Citrobacter pasteurii TaxID=1563222 RepID=UPI001AE0D66E